MKLKIRAIIVGMLVSIIGLTACTNNTTAETPKKEAPKSEASQAVNPESYKQVSIDFWTVWKPDAESGMGKVIREASEKFMVENPNIIINVANQGGYDAIAEKVESAIVAKNTPTLATVEETFVGRFSPVTVDMSTYLSESVINNYNEGLLISTKIDEVIRAVPFGRSTTILYMNKTLLEKSGLSLEGPKTWEEYEQYAEKMTDPANGVFGAGQDWDTDAWIWESMLYSYGGEIISEDNKTVLFNETSAGSDIVARMQKMAKAGTLFNPYEQQGDAWDILKSKFVEGKVGMMVNSIASSAGLQKLMKENGQELTIAFQPKGTQYSVPTGGNNIIMFESASEEQKLAAAKFLEFLASDDIAAGLSKETGYFPVTKSSVDHPLIKERLVEFPEYQIAIDQLQYAHSRPMTKNWKNMYNVIMEELKATMVDTNTDPVQAIKTAAESSQTILDQNP